MKLSGVWKKIALAFGGFAFFEIGARIGLPGVNIPALLANPARRNPLLDAFDLLGGGATKRGAVLALGIFPYITAKIMMRLVRIVSPDAQALHDTSDGRDRLMSWTRRLTLALAAIQGYGLATYVQNVPGAVEHPGIGFIAQTMLILTAGSAVAMTITEALLSPGDEEGAPRERAVLEEGDAPAAPLKTSQSVASDVR